MKYFSTYLNKNLQNPELRKEFLRVHYIDDLADQIILLRNKRDISQSKLAELANTTQAVVSRIENGSVNSSLNTIQKISEALNASIKIDVIPDEEMIFQEFFMNYIQSSGIDSNQSDKENDSLDGIFINSSKNCQTGDISQQNTDLLYKENFEKALV